jgi:hypothetical protein
MVSNQPIQTDACERAAVSRAQVIGTRVGVITRQAVNGNGRGPDSLP